MLRNTEEPKNAIIAQLAYQKLVPGPNTGNRKSMNGVNCATAIEFNNRFITQLKSQLDVSGFCYLYGSHNCYSPRMIQFQKTSKLKAFSQIERTYTIFTNSPRLILRVPIII